MDIVDKLKSQIGDDVQHVFDHDALFKAAAAEIEQLRSALKLMVSTYPYSPPCHGWEAQVEAHKAAKAALSNS